MYQESFQNLMDVEWDASRVGSDPSVLEDKILDSLELPGPEFGEDEEDALHDSIGDLGIDFDIFPEITQDSNSLSIQSGEEGTATKAGKSAVDGSELVGSHNVVENNGDDGSRPQSPNQSNSSSGVAESLHQGGSSAVQPATPPLDTKGRQPDKDAINVHVQNSLWTEESEKKTPMAALSDSNPLDNQQVSKKRAASTLELEDDDKRHARLQRNRESAMLSRQRKKMHQQQLEQQLGEALERISQYEHTISALAAENSSLKRQVDLLVHSQCNKDGGKDCKAATMEQIKPPDAIDNSGGAAATIPTPYTNAVVGSGMYFSPLSFMHNPIHFQMPLPPLPPGAPRGALKPAKSTRVTNLEKKRAEERANKSQTAEPSSILKPNAAAKGISKQAARTAKASAAVFALLSFATFFSNPISNFGYTGSEVVLFNNAELAGEDDLTFSSGRVLLALDDGSSPWTAEEQGFSSRNLFKDNIDTLFPDPSEDRIWNKTCVEQIEVIDMAVTKERLKSFPRLHVNRTAESESLDHSDAHENGESHSESDFDGAELSDEETFQQMEALSNVALVAVGEGLEENWKQASWESEGILTTMECVEVFEFQQSGPHNTKSESNAGQKTDSRRRRQGISTAGGQRESLPGYDLKDTRISNDKEYQVAVGPSLRGVGQVRMPVIPIVEDDDPSLIYTRGLGSDDRKGVHGADLVVSVLVPTELSSSMGQMSQVIVVVGVKKSQYMTYSCTVPSAKSSFPWTPMESIQSNPVEQH